jgi:hypothetical protein
MVYSEYRWQQTTKTCSEEEEDPKTETKQTRYVLGNLETEKDVRSRKSKIRWVVFLL